MMVYVVSVLIPPLAVNHVILNLVLKNCQKWYCFNTRSSLENNITNENIPRSKEKNVDTRVTESQDQITSPTPMLSSWR